MRFINVMLNLTILVSTVQCNFKVDKCDLELRTILNNDKSPQKPNERILNSNNKSNIDLHLFVNGINNLDYLSNVFDFQYGLIEVWRDVNLSIPIDVENELILIDNPISIEQKYPNLLVNEIDYNHLYNLNNQNDDQIYRQYYYIPIYRILVKILKINQRNRCQISMQNYPFIHQTCRLNFRQSEQLPSHTNYTICNLKQFLDKQFDFNKFDAEITSLNTHCIPLNNLEHEYLKLTSCFQLLITFKSSKRFFYIYFLITFVLLLISYLSLWVPIYSHTSRVALLVLPIIGLYLFDSALLKQDKILFKESTSLHIWYLACILYISLNFFYYILAFYSLERVKLLVEQADIGYLGYMLQNANLVQDASAFTNQMHNFDQPRKYSVKAETTPLFKKQSLPMIRQIKSMDLDIIGRNLKNCLNVKSSKCDTIPSITSKGSRIDLSANSSKMFTSKTDLNLAKSTLESTKNVLTIKPSILKKVSLIKNKTEDTTKQLVNQKSDPKLKIVKFQLNSGMSLKTISPKTSSPKEISTPIASSFTMSIKKELDDLKRDLTLLHNDLNKNKYKINKKKKKTLKVLNDILTFKNPRKERGQLRKKKIVSRFISSSKLRKIEFISLVPSDRYARFIVPLSFFLFFYFYALHFIF